MSYASASRCAAETAVGDKGNAVSKPHTHNCRGGVQHLTHTGSAFWTFVTNYHHVAGLYFSCVNGALSILFAIKDLGRSFVHQHFRKHRRALYHAASGRQISSEHCNTACFAEGFFHRTYYFVIKVDTALNIFSDSLAGNGETVKRQKLFL